MDYQSMTKEALIKEIEKLNKKLYHKAAARLSWKKIMNGQIVKGPDYWSNRRFALKNEVTVPEAVTKLNSLDERTTETSLELLIGTTVVRKITNKALWTEIEEDGLKMVRTEQGVKFQKLYIDALSKLVPDFTLAVAETAAPALIEKEGRVLGALMPCK